MRHDCPFVHAEEETEAGGPPLALPLMWGATACHRCLSADACLGYLRHRTRQASRYSMGARAPHAASQGLAAAGASPLAARALRGSEPAHALVRDYAALGSPAFPQGLRRGHFRTR